MPIINTPDNDPKKGRSISRALKIMEFIASKGNVAALMEISQGVGLSKSTVHDVLNILEHLNYVRKDDLRGKYRLGLKLFELGIVVHESLDLREIAEPYVKELANKYHETVHMGVLSEGEVIIIDKMDGLRSFYMKSKIGIRTPSYCTSLGKSLLSGLSETDLDKLFQNKQLIPFTKNTFTDLALLKEELCKVRELGYVFDIEEIEEGVHCVGAPIKNHQGLVIAAISVTGPANRVTTERMKELAEDVKRVATEISCRMGYKSSLRNLK